MSEEPRQAYHRHDSIGIFDSGVGGGTVLRHIHQLLPGQDLLFLADQINCPYGSRHIDELRELSAANTRWLLERGATLIVVACNTASAGALYWLRRAFPDVPFVGMVPAVKPAAQRTESGVVGVMATPATIQGRLLQEVIDRWADDVEVVSQVCHGLVEQIEAGAFDTPETEQLLRRCLDPLLAAGADTLVLGCTHYPYLLPQIQCIAGPDVTVLDAAPAVARQVQRVLHRRNLLHTDPDHAGTVTYATTGDLARFADLLAQLELPSGVTIHATEIRGDKETGGQGE